MDGNHAVLLITFSHSQHHSRVDVQLAAQFSAYFQRGLAKAGVSQYVIITLRAGRCSAPCCAAESREVSSRQQGGE